MKQDKELEKLTREAQKNVRSEQKQEKISARAARKEEKAAEKAARAFHKKQQEAASLAMRAWISGENTFGKKPAALECAGEFDVLNLHYYYFRFRLSLRGKWLLAVCGGYEKNSLTHCGHIFSEGKPFDERTAKGQALALVGIIRHFRAQQEQEDFQDGIIEGSLLIQKKDS